MPSVGALGEDGLVAGVIAAFAGAGRPPWLTVGPGDDAAVIDLSALAPGGSLVASTDTLVQDEDFRLAWSSAADVGVKVAAQNFADIAAMGAVPAVLLVSLAIPADTDSGWAQGLAAGLREECSRAGAVIAGGDVSQAREIVITGTALGVLPAGRPAVLRSGARPGDVVAIAGQTGRSGAGLALLARGLGDAGALPGAASPLVSPVVGALIASHRRPHPPYAAGPAAAAAGAVAMIDTSDGLIRDAGRIAAASSVAIDLDSAALTPSAELEAAALLAGDGPARDWVLTGGEDHALLACFGPDAALPSGFRVIGTVIRAGAGPDPAPGLVLVDGRPWAGAPGWRHFGPP